MTLTISETRDIALCRALRRRVFTLEQGVSEADELDENDAAALHLLALQDGVAVGTARVLVMGNVGKIGRVCVLASARGTGIGAALITEAVDRCKGMTGVTIVRLGAQTHALAFYARLGFASVGAVYIDAGIPHRDMERMLVR